jgi:AraC-like DNA-binding protein
MSNGTLIHIENRKADSPLIQTVWRSQSEQSGPFLSIASNRMELVVARHEGKLYCSLRGPETRATVANVPPEGEWLGIQFKLGVLMPHLPTVQLVDGDIVLPAACTRSFWLKGSAWEYPTFENAEVFVERLVRQGLLMREPAVEAALQDQPAEVTARSVQRRFLRATGLTRGAAMQIARARHATNLLQQGTSIGDTVELAGYYDQPHLTKSLRKLIGQTPAQLLAKGSAMQLSFLAGGE